MDILILSTGKTKTVNDSFGARMIEQGKAVTATATAKPPKVKRTRKDVTPDGTDGQDQQ